MIFSQLDIRESFHLPLQVSTKISLYLAILTVAAQGLDIIVEDAVSVEDMSSVHLVEGATRGAHPVEIDDSSSVRSFKKDDTAIERVLKKAKTKKSTKAPTRSPTNPR